MSFCLLVNQHANLYSCDNLRAYLGFLSIGFSQPSKMFIILQALALRAPSWLITLARHAPLRRLRVLKEAKASSLAWAKNLIQEIRARPEGLEDLHILNVLGIRVVLYCFRTFSQSVVCMLQHELLNNRPPGSSDE